MYLLLFINQTDAYDYVKYSKTHYSGSKNASEICTLLNCKNAYKKILPFCCGKIEYIAGELLYV